MPRIRVSWGSVFICLLLGLWSYPSLAESVSAPWALAGATLLAISLAVAVVCHELSHALVARMFGSRVVEIALTITGGHTRYRAQAIGPGKSLLISLAGPLANLALAGAYHLSIVATSRLLELTQVYSASFEALYTIAYVAAWSRTLNLVLAAFNMIPGLPLDGGRVLEAILVMCRCSALRATQITAWLGKAAAIGLVVLVALPPLMAGRQPALFLLLWSVVIAVTLYAGAQAALREVTVMKRVRAISLPAVSVAVAPVTPDATVDPTRLTPSSTGLFFDTTGQLWRLNPEALAQASRVHPGAAVRLASLLERSHAAEVLPPGLSDEQVLEQILQNPAEAWLRWDPVTGTPYVIFAGTIAKELRIH